MNYLSVLRELSTLKSNEKKTAEQLHALQKKKLIVNGFADRRRRA